MFISLLNTMISKRFVQLKFVWLFSMCSHDFQCAWLANIVYKQTSEKSRKWVLIKQVKDEDI